jgi:hypothetical protein
MHRPMMGPAQQRQIAKVGGAAMEPMPHMMGLTPAQGPITVGEDTAVVADGQGDPLGGLDDPAGPPDLQGLGGGAAQDRGEPGHRGLDPLGQAGLTTRVAAVAVAARVVVVAAGAGG